MFEDGAWQVLEPVMNVEINIPEEYQGAVMAGINKRQAVIKATEGNDGFYTVYCEVSTLILLLVSLFVPSEIV